VYHHRRPYPVKLQIQDSDEGGEGGDDATSSDTNLSAEEQARQLVIRKQQRALATAAENVTLREELSRQRVAAMMKDCWEDYERFKLAHEGTQTKSISSNADTASSTSKKRIKTDFVLDLLSDIDQERAVSGQRVSSTKRPRMKSSSSQPTRDLSSDASLISAHLLTDPRSLEDLCGQLDSILFNLPYPSTSSSSAEDMGSASRARTTSEPLLPSEESLLALSQLVYNTDVGYVSSLLRQGLLDVLMNILARPAVTARHRETILRVIHCLPVNKSNIDTGLALYRSILDKLAADGKQSLDKQFRSMAAVAVKIMREWRGLILL
jgi:hypothetical protein